MTGTFEYEKGDKRAAPDFNVFFRHFATYPYYSDAVWYLTQMRRWGQIAEAKPDAWYVDDGQVGLPARPLPARPPRLLVAEGKAKEADFPWTPTAIKRADRRVHRRRRPTTAASPTPISTASPSA